MQTFLRKRRVRIAAAVLVLLAVGSGVAYATIPDSNKVFTACKLNLTGTIRLIDPSVGNTSLLGRCTSLETQVTWNQGGQPGLAGKDGGDGVSVASASLPAGDANCPSGGSRFTSANGNTYACNGAGHAYVADACGSSSFCPAMSENTPLDLASVALPAGTYVLMGSMGSLIIRSSGALVRCDLVDSTNAVLAAGTPWHEVPVGQNNERHLLGAVTLSSTGTVKIHCAFTEGGAENVAIIQSGRLVAIRVDGLN
jgi:hypothetical protein